MSYFFRRFQFAILQFPKRLMRLVTFPLLSFYHWENGGSLLRSFPVLLTDCFFILDFYEVITPLFKKNVRPLTQREILRGQEILGNSIDYQLVRLDEQAKLVTRSQGVVYVSGNTINSWGVMPDDVLIHELVHIWQYQHFGAGYIACALKAQASEVGYNYQNTEGWYQKKSILNFNAEQQGDLVQDYFRIKTGLKPHWGNYTKADLSKYEKYIEEIRNKKIMRILG